MTTVTDEMAQRGMAAFDAYQWDISPIDAMRAALSAALAVMPVPTDAEFNQALAAFENESNAFVGPDGRGDRLRYQDARRTLLAMHAQAKQQGLQKVRADIHDRAQMWWRTSEHGMGYGDALDWALEQIDAMLGGSHE